MSFIMMNSVIWGEFREKAWPSQAATQKYNLKTFDMKQSKLSNHWTWKHHTEDKSSIKEYNI